jgi:error-prone DNA polymerase
LEPDPASAGGLALRLGLRLVKGLSQAAAERLVAMRGAGYPDPHALWRLSALTAKDLSGLAAADAFRSMGLDRRAAEWAVRGLKDAPMPLFATLDPSQNPRPEPAVGLPLMPIGAQVLHDYANLGLSLKAHPLAFLREGLSAEGAIQAARLIETKPGKRASVAGLVLVRQRPGTASGVIFMTLEDESGIANLVVWPARFEEFRRVVLTSSLLLATGIVQREGLVVHLIVETLEDRSHRLGELAAVASSAEKDFRRASRDFR